MEDFIFYLILSILSLFTLYRLNKKSKKEINNNDNKVVTLMMNKFYLYFGYLSISIGLISSIMIFSNERDLILSIIFIAIFGGTGLILVYLSKNHRISIYDTKIEVFNLFGNKKTILWSELSDVKFNFFKGTLVLVDNKNEKLNIHQHIVGFKTIIQKIKSQSNLNIDKIKLPF